LSQSILERVRQANQLPTLPAVAIRVLEMTRSQDVSMGEIAEVVQQDPGLTAKILRVVNSTLYGMPREVSSLRQAMALLGLQAVKVLALSFSVAEAIHETEEEGFGYQLFWRRSLTTSVAGRLLSRSVAPSVSEEAFVAGLLADAGMVAAWWCAAEEYRPVLEAWKGGRNLTEVETEVLGVTHARIGEELLRQWNLPEELCLVVGAHHGEGIERLGGAAGEVARVVRAAAEIAAVFCGEAHRLPQVKAWCVSQAGIGEAELESVLVDLDDRVKDAAKMLSLPIGRTVNYSQLQADAAVRLVQMSIEAMEEPQAVSPREGGVAEAVRLEGEMRRILEAASTDGLTGVANRAAFDQRLAEELEGALAGGRSLGLIMLDVDHFKRFNDTYGHQAGDEVLRGVAAALREVVEGVGFVARYGGEEFAVIVREGTKRRVGEIADEIRSAIESRLVVFEGNPLRVTASLGVACAEAGCGSMAPKELIGAAD
jgi:diguanylate cyclase (GGDEF)-like protein